MFGLGPWELGLVFLAILLLFGAKRLPEIASGLGKGIREFKKSVKDTSEELKGSLNEPKESSPAPPVDPPPKTDNDKKPE